MRAAIAKKTLARLRGQGMTEYIVIVALIAIAAIGAFTYFGRTIRAQVAGVAYELSGNDAKNQISSAGDAAGQTDDQAVAKKGLSSYNGN